jgi:hypothetical protein
MPVSRTASEPAVGGTRPSGLLAGRPWLRRRTIQLVYRVMWGAASLDRPLFIVGCGRSGTTLLGEVLGRHPELGHQNERRDIWVVEPRTDVWSRRAAARGGRVELGAEDARPAVARAVACRFAAELWLAGKPRMVSKTPINAFRIGWLAAMFPDARFIHIVRDGFRVAESIARYGPTVQWYGHGDYKWRLLVEAARRRGLGELVPLCADDVARGMLEWRLSVTTAREALHRLSPERWIEIRYEALLRDPTARCADIEAFAALAPSAAMRAYAAQAVREPAAPPRPPRSDLERIGGPLLGEFAAEVA